MTAFLLVIALTAAAQEPPGAPQAPGTPGLERVLQAPGEPVEVWRRLRGAYADHLAEAPGDPAGQRAAAFLRRSTVALEASDLQKRLGEDVFAAYDPARRVVELDRRGLEEVWLSLRGAELHPERARPFIERTASAVVHELRHAMDHEASGEAPVFLEHEVNAYAEQALFLRARLAREPGYRGLAGLDRQLSGASSPRWWTRPLPADSLAKLKAAAADARRAAPERVTSQEASDWFVVRSMARGVRGLRKSLAAAGFLPAVSVLEPPKGVAESSRRELEHLWRQLAVLRSTRLPPQEKERRAKPVEAQLEAAERAALFWGDGERRARAAGFIRKELELRDKEWEELP